MSPSRAGRFDVERWSDADKVLLLSGLTLPFALAWFARFASIHGGAEASPYVSLRFLPVILVFSAIQALGHAMLVLAAAWARRRPGPSPWLVHGEIQFWFACMAFSLYAVGPFTSSFGVLVLALPVVGYLLFEARPMNLGLWTGGLGTAVSIVLPQLGVVPYAPFLTRAPFEEGRLHNAWILMNGVPSIFATSVVLLIFTRLIRRLRDRQAELLRLSNTDPLTGLKNRRIFFTRLDEELARSRRYGHPLCVVMVDVDHFKSINDSFGHVVGDEVLCKVAEALRDALRVGDLAARYGGEEFALLLPHTPAGGAVVVAERLLGIARKVEVGERAPGRTITVSIGIAQLEPDETSESLVARADSAMYASKRGGRDRASVAEAGAAGAEGAEGHAGERRSGAGERRASGG